MLRIDDLVSMSKSELDDLFREGDTPDEGALNGQTRGHVLAGRGLLRVEPLRQAVNGPYLPWKGKGIEEGEGWNRFGYGSLEHQGFEFETRTAPSLLPDDNDVLIFDYDQPENPPGIRRIRDDLKEIDRGLFLGTSNIKVGGGYRFILYFALEETVSDLDLPEGEMSEIGVE